MIIIDIFILLFVAGLLLIGTPIVVKKLASMNPKRKEIEAAHNFDEIGETNTVRFNLAELRRCTFCNRLTDPKKDLKVAASWMHQDCYTDRLLEITKKEDK